MDIIFDNRQHMYIRSVYILLFFSNFLCTLVFMCISDWREKIIRYFIGKLIVKISVLFNKYIVICKHASNESNQTNSLKNKIYYLLK